MKKKPEDLDEVVSRMEWWDTADILDKDILNIVSLFNDCANVYGFKFSYVKFHKNLPLKEQPFYKDAFTLMRIINGLGAKPRDFIVAQFKYYKKKHSMARSMPSFAMMLQPAAIDKWKRLLNDLGITIPEATTITKEQILKYNVEKMRNLMEKYKMVNEEDFFRDPALLSQLSRNFVEANPTFSKLVNENYYEITFGLKEEELFAK